MINPNPSRAAASRGGRAKTPAKLAALQALHAKLRGHHRNDAGERETTLCDLAAALTTPKKSVCSIRAVAGHCGVSDRTVRRWLDGTDWPPASALRAIRAWLKPLSTKFKSQIHRKKTKEKK